MADHYIREADNILKRENTETGFTVRLHFAQDHPDDRIIEEIQKILTETYINSLMRGNED